MSCLIHRVYHIASSFTIFHEDLDVLRTKFLKNGFPLGLFDNTVGNFLNKLYLPEEKRYTVPKRAVTMVLPYLKLGPLSIVIRRRLRRLIVKYYPLIEFNIVFKRRRTIRSIFCCKDKFRLRCRSRVVYHIQCEVCGPVRLTSVKPSIHSTNASMGQMDTYTRPLNLAPCLST